MNRLQPEGTVVKKKELVIPVTTETKASSNKGLSVNSGSE